jgi:uncharacterized protein YciI
MQHFAVILERGPAWDWSLPMRRQAEWEAHAAFMDALADEGFIVAGGPLGGENDAARVLHIVAALDASAIEMRLAQDPWAPMHLLKTVSIEPWTVLLGRLSGAAP